MRGLYPFSDELAGIYKILKLLQIKCIQLFTPLAPLTLDP